MIMRCPLFGRLGFDRRLRGRILLIAVRAIALRDAILGSNQKLLNGDTRVAGDN